MSNPEDHHGASRRPSWREERLREQIVQTLVERCKLDSTAEVVLREIVSQCSVGGEIGGRFTFQLPAAIGLDQQIKIARPLRELLQKRREDVARQLERIEGVGSNMATIVRHAIANPLVIVAGKSPLDGYLRICRESAMHWGIVRALQHLRDALTATNETFFSNPSRHSFTWRLNLDRITPAMLHRVERCLRDVDPRAIHDAACNQWLKNLQLFFDQVKAGTFQLPASPGAAQAPLAGKTAEMARPPSPPAPPPAATPCPVLEPSPGFGDGLRRLRERLLPQYLELAPEDFAALCRSEPGVWDFAQRLGAAIERFCVHCLTALREKLPAGCKAGASQSEATPADAAVEAGTCVRWLAEEAALLRDWLQRELPQEENSVGRRMLALVESSLVSGLFFLFLQQRFAGLFRDAGDEDCDDPHRRAEAKAVAARRMTIVHGIEASLEQQRSTLLAALAEDEAPAVALDVVRCCESALAAVLPLFVLAAHGTRQDAAEQPPGGGKLHLRFLSAAGACADASQAQCDPMEFVDYEPGVFPPLRCRYFAGAEEPGAAGAPAQVCRFSRRGGVAISPHIAIPVSALFAEESRLARTADFLGSIADRHLAHWRQLAGSMGIRQCIGCLENSGAPLARIELRGGDCGGVTLLALPTAAMAMSDDFAENITLPQALQQSRKKSPARAALLRAVQDYWLAKGIEPGGYSLCVLKDRHAAGEQSEATEDDQRWRRRVRRFLSQKGRWPLPEAEQILKALDIVIEPKEDGAPHGKVRLGDRHHTLSSKLLKDGQVYATYLYEWIRTLGQERLLADLLRRKDPRLTPYMRKTDTGEE